MQLPLPTQIPMWLVPAVAAVMLVLAVAGVLAAVTYGRRIERRKLGGEQPTAREERTDRLFLTLAVLSCLGLWLGIFASNWVGLTGFAEHFLHRTGWQVQAVPITLDGVAVGAVFMSFVLILRRKNPWKCTTLIWGMTLFSAYCGFSFGENGGTGSVAAGLYYAVMSVVGMLMFHMFLDLFHDHGSYVRTGIPALGIRYFTHWSTVLVLLAWVNHPPRHRTETAAPSSREAIDHWQVVRRAKRVRAAERSAARHARKLTRARRDAELAVARTGRPAHPASASAPRQVGTAGQPAVPAQRAASAGHPVPVGALPPAGHPVPVGALPTAGPVPAAEPAAPTTPTGAGLATGADPGAPSAGSAAAASPTTAPAEPAGPAAAGRVTAAGARRATPAVGGDRDRGPAPKLPASAYKCEEWAELWVTISEAHPEVAAGQRALSDDEARRTVGCTSRQVRNVRAAARSGLLRQRVTELGATLPDGYHDRPEEARAGARPLKVARSR